MAQIRFLLHFGFTRVMSTSKWHTNVALFGGGLKYRSVLLPQYSIYFMKYHHIFFSMKNKVNLELRLLGALRVQKHNFYDL